MATTNAPPSTPATDAREPRTIGVAISGGGHRATAYGLGVLLYLVDSGLNRKVQTIASVSGGSLLNAFVALLGSPRGGETRSFRSLGFGELDRHAARLASLLAGHRAVWFASVAVAFGGTGLALVLSLLSAIDGRTALLSSGALLLGVSFLVGPRSGGSLWGWWGTWLYCGAVAWLAAAGVIAARALSFRGVEIVLLVVLCGWLIQQRHRVAERAFEHTICRPLVRSGGWAVARARLEDMGTEVRHVFCATEMHSGQHAYFSHDFVYARGFGLGRPAGLPVATAVQASANFPGGFPIRSLDASPFGFSLTDRFEDAVEHGIRYGRDILMPDQDERWANDHRQFAPMRRLPGRLLLSDGGVFDNLAVDWYLENASRRSRFRMSLNWTYDADRADWVHDETLRRDESLLSPLEDSPDALIVVNAGVTSHWRRGARTLLSVPILGEAIGLSRISGTMYNNYTKERIRALGDALVVEMGFSERLVPTTLLPLGERVTADLIHAGYQHAMSAAMRRFGHPQLAAAREDFAPLARGERGVRVRKLFTLGG